MTRQLYQKVVMKPGWIYAFLLLSIVLRGCGTGSHMITPEQLARITIGITTQQQVQNHLGEPKEKIIVFENEREYTKWNYLLTTRVHDLQTGVPPIGVTQVPITRAHRQTTEVGIIFDQNGLVTEFRERM
ncbi:outer membrane protein assembly factor BamE domain-containing protein [Nitrospira sp. T9]|uniref:outer membrane protein assembly factor BamE domain-containing protein n=1 Tax=unclassified Nitrospira TaxID=2652172 RepID=UPI003F9E2AAD